MARYQTVPVNITGPTYQSRSRPLSSQRTVNMYQQLAEGGKDQYVLHSFPGQKLISTVGEQQDRGIWRMNEILYRVVDDVLYQVSSAGAHSNKGTVTGGGRCIFADDGENLVIVSDKVYVYNAATNIFKENTNVNLKDVLSVTFINNQFIYTTAELSFMSEPGDPFDISGLNGIGAESNPDKLARDYVFNQFIYRFGDRTVETWYNTTAGTPPIDRIDGRMYSVGLGAIHSLNNTDNALYWLGDDNAIYRMSGGQPERISDDGLSNTLEMMSKTDDAHGHTFTLQGQDFYMLTFPAGKRTFVVNESLGKNGWFELSSTNQNKIYSGTSIIDVYGKNFVASGGKLLELKLDEYTQNTDVMIRERITSSINAELIGGTKGQRVKMSRIEFIMEAGVGLMTGQGENPRIMIEPSYDGGRSFVGQDWVEIGQLGEHTLRVEWYNLMSFQDLILRITLSDPVPFSIYSAVIDLKMAGR